ncbi:MAG: SRPBCC family protein [Acidimicrobiia bacterium]
MADETSDRNGRTYVLRETRTINRPLEEVFEYAADFSNSAEWDPGVDSAKAVEPGPVRVGSSYSLEGTFGPSTLPMHYEVVEYEPPHRVVLQGRGEKFDALDTMEFTSSSDGSTQISYTAEITLFGPLRYLGPLMSWPLDRMGKKALDGLVEALKR